MKKRRRRFGDRADGRRVRTLSPIDKVSPYIMSKRSGAQNMFSDSIVIDRIEEYLREKKQNGFPHMSMMHVLVAAYIRAVSQRPALNRFISGQKVYSRDDHIEVTMTIKKEMKLEAPDTIVKLDFKPTDTIDDVYRAFERVITEYREEPGSDLDDTAKILSFIPGLLMKFTVGLLKLMDYFGILPRFLLRVSPFHASMYMTSMGSLGIPPVFHHLYDFGNVPLFIAFGAKKRRLDVQEDGTVKKVSYIDLTISMDERICDGFYFASAYKCLRSYMKNPSVLDTPPETVNEDID